MEYTINGDTLQGIANAIRERNGSTESMAVSEFANEIENLPKGGSENGATFTPSVSEDGILSWTNDKGLENPAPVDIKGVSPTISVTAITGGHRITITDKNGTKTVDVMNGEDGRGIKSVARTSGTGAAGTTDTYTITYSDNTTSTFTVYNGKDGVSPTISVSSITGGHRITITDKNGTKTVDVMNGEDGRGIKSVTRTSGNGSAGTTDTYTITYTDNTTSTFTVYNGKNGTNGTSVTVTKVTESTVDGGENVVTFSDGKTLKVKNGRTGTTGADGKDGEDGKTPVKGVDYFNEADKAEFSQYIASELAKRGQLKPEFANSVDELKASGDTSKLYVLPDGYIYAHMLTEKPAYTNILSTAVDTDGKPYNGGLGYKTGHRIKSNLEELDVDGFCSTGYIPVAVNDVIRIKNTTIAPGSGGMHLFYNASFAKARFGMYENYEEPSGAYNTKPDANGVITLTIPSNGETPIAYYRYSTGVINDASIFTINQEITDGTIKEYAWANTGHAFVPADYEDRILELENESNSHESRLAEVEKAIESGDFDDKTFDEKIIGFKYWDRAIFDRVPTYTLADESKDAITEAMMTSDTIYQKYDDLMTLANNANSQYITKTLLGQDEAGYDVYRYDFKMPEQPRLETAPISKSVPKIILVSGVHCEWAGIYALYNTMCEITNNPDLIDLKRNVHFIVLPMVNAHAGNTRVRKNVNGVDIARNFEIDFIANTDTTAETYGGTAPLSELESQYVDKVMSENTDAWFFVSCHNYFNSTDDYVHLWGSAATRYFHNLCQKLVDKLSRAWGSKYSFVPDNTYLGASETSAPKGSEGRQAIKYGIQGGTLECRCNFPYHSETNYTAFSQSRATEVYINFLLTALGNFEACDKRDLNDYDGQP